MKLRPRNPKTPEEWQRSVNAAEFFLLVESSKQYGLVEGGPEVDQERCLEVLKAGAALGIRPARHEQLIEEFRCFFEPQAS